MNPPNLLDAVRIVKGNERIAADFYATEAKKFTTAINVLFEQLSSFEEFHFKKLTELEASLEKNGDFIHYTGREFILPPKFELTATPGLKSMIQVILEAMKLEKKAETAYADLAAQIDDEQGHQMFVMLAEEEHKHYWILEKASTSLNQTGVWKWEPGK